MMLISVGEIIFIIAIILFLVFVVIFQVRRKKKGRTCCEKSNCSAQCHCDVTKFVKERKKVD